MNVSKRENLDYEADLAEWKKTYGGKVIDTISIRDRLRQKEQSSYCDFCMDFYLLPERSEQRAGSYIERWLAL